MTSEIPDKTPDRTPIKKLAKVRLWAGYIFIFFALIFASPTLVGVICGFGLIIAGAAVRLAASATLVKDTELCTTGIYSLTRNPLYFGSALVGLGYAALTSSYVFLIAYLGILMPIYMFAISLEEKYLAGLFSESFPAYVKSTPRFFPALRPLTGLPGSFDISRLKKSREIYSTLLFLLIAIILVAVHSSWITGQG